MTLEASRSTTNEPLKPAEFYSPITDPVKTLKKLTELSVREATDVELFEAVVDTFATIATIDFELGVEEVIDGEKLKAEDWQHTDEVSFATSQSDLVFIGYGQQPKDGEFKRWEESFIEGYSFFEEQSPASISFERNTDGSVRAFTDVGDDEDKIEYSMPTVERKKIIEALLQGLNSKAPIAA